MRSFKGQSQFNPAATQPEIYSPSRADYQNRTTNITQTSKNKNRTQQIVLLHQEFEDLKRKIKQVQNKNQKIIQKIHRQCNFKKKTPQTFDISGEGPIVYYEKKEKSQVSQKSGMSLDESNKSDQSQYEFRQKKSNLQRNSVQSNKHIPQKNFTQSMQYTRDDMKNEVIKKKYSKISQQQHYDEEEPDSRELIEDDFEQQSNQKFQMQASHQTYNHLKEYTNSAKSSGKKSQVISSYPASQTHMSYSQFNQSQQMHQHSQQVPRPPQQLFTPLIPHPQPSRISQQSNSNLIIYQLEQSLKIQKQKTTYLQQQLKNKQIQIMNVKKEYNKLLGQFENVEMIIEDNLEQFFETTVKKGFFDIDKQLKKYENRLRNMAINIKDEYEEHKSSRLIKEHQLRRSNSRSRKDLSPAHNTSIHSVITPGTQQAKIPRPGSSQGSSFLQQPQQHQNIQPSQTSLLQGQIDKRSRISQQSKKNKQFEQIVQKYQQMINSKKDQISKLQLLKRQVQRKNQSLQKQLQVKQVQARQFKQRLQQLDKLMSQMSNQGPIQTRTTKRQYRISSTQSNLLQDIEHDNNNNDDDSQQAKYYQRLYNQAKRDIQLKDNQIQQLSLQIQQYEHKLTEYQQRHKQHQLKIKKLQQASSSQSIRVSQKSTIDNLAKKQHQQSIKQHLQQLHQLQITHKDSQIAKYKQSTNRLQKKLVEKDCQNISLVNKVKKLQGVNQLNCKKIEEYEKMLNHYQHNYSVDMGESAWNGGSVLDRSLCQQGQRLTSRSTTGVEQSGRKIDNMSNNNNKQRIATTTSKNTITITKAQFQSLQQQLKQMSQQILQLTKKLKLSEKANSQKTTQIQRLLEEIDLKVMEVKRCSLQNNQLKSRVGDLQEELKQLKSLQGNQQQEQQQLQLENEWNQQSNYQNKSSSQHKQPLPNKRKPLHRKNLSQLQPILPSRLPSRKPSQQQSLQYNHLQQSITRLQQQLSSTKTKNIELSTLYNTLKSQHLQISRNNITLKKNNEYLQESLSDREQKYQKYKRQYEQLKARNSQLLESLQHKEEQLNKQKLQNCQKINQLEKQWHQFEEQINKNNNNTNNNEHLKQSMYSKNNHDTSQLLKSSRYNISQSSLLLSSTIHNKNSQYLQEQNQYLTIKLKQAQATIEMHNLMEEKVLNQYKANVDKLKSEVKQKHKECEMIRKELQVVNDAKRRLEVLYQSSKNYLAQSRMELNNSNNNNTPIINRKRQPSQSSSLNNISNKKPQHQGENDQSKDLAMQQFPSYNQDNNNLSMMSGQQNLQKNLQQSQQQRLYPYERILELQGQLKQAKDINHKLQEMEEQLFKQIRLKQEEKKDLCRLIDQKNLKIQQLEEIVELKDNNNISSSHLGSNILGSHISSSNYKSSSNHKHSSHNLSQRQSMHSHSSLRYSGITHLKNPTILLNNNPSSNHLQIMGQSQFGTSQRFDIQLSQTGSQMLDKSYVTNISEIFQKEEFPYQKVQLKRKQQIKLFQKTASYIKSLKQSINEKNKRIKLLEKKIQSLKSTHHGPISKQLQNKYEISTRANENTEDLQIEFQTVFKDYQSVQLQRKKASHNKRYKNLQHQWKLAIQQNNVLSNQVQVLQQQLEKAEQQQNTILVMKDLYKDEIKKLLAKNQQQTAYYQDLLNKEKKKVQESQSVHNLQTIKQLFLKVVDAIIVMESQKSKKKREEKKKDIQQFFKIFASLCAVEQPKKNAIIQGIKKMTLNIVLAEDGRAASKGKQ